MIYRGCLFYFFIYAWGGLFSIHMSPWLKSTGISVTDIGLLLSIGAVTKLVSDPVIARIADQQRVRKLMLLALLIVVSVSQSLLLLSSSTILEILAYIVMVVAWSPIIALGDSIISISIQNNNWSYGFVRSWASISIALIVTISTLFNIGIGYGSSILIMIFCSCCATIVATRLDDLSIGCLPRSITQKAKFGAEFWRIGIVSALTLSSHFIFYSLGSLSLLNNGYSSTDANFLWLAAMAAEASVFIFLGKYGERIQFKPRVYLLAGAVGGLVRWSIWAISTDFSLLFLAQLLQGLSLSLVNYAFFMFVCRSVPPDSRSFAFTSIAAFSHGIFPIILVTTSASLYEIYGQAAFIVGAIACLISIILNWITMSSAC